MRSLTGGQQAILAAPAKSVTWLFQVQDIHLTRYYWSTKAVPATGVGVTWESGTAWESGVVWTDGGDGTGYAFRVVGFDGLTLARPKLEHGALSPATLTFTATNRDGTIQPSDFEGGSVKLILMMGDTVAEETELAIWKFSIKRVNATYQTLEFLCEDFLQQHLEGDYPVSQYRISGDAVVWGTGIAWATGVGWTGGTSNAGYTFSLKVHDIFPHTSGVGHLSDYVCLPLPFGVAYVPIRPAYIADGWYYVLGQTVANGATITYTISAVRSPRDYSVKVENTGTFTQATKTSADGLDFRVFTAALDDAPVDGLYPLGDHYYDLPTKFSRSDTVSLTDFADVIRYVLLDIGVDPLDIDEASFAAAKATFTGWGLACAGAFWHVTSRQAAIVSLLAHCHSTLVVGEQIALRVLDATSQQTITAADILRRGASGAGTYSHSRLERTLADCGAVEYAPTDDVQDVSLTALVAAGTTKRVKAEAPLSLPFLADGTIARKLGRLYWQRTLWKAAEERFTTKATALALEPGDVLTLSGVNYGGAHKLLVDRMTIHKDCSVDFTCTAFSGALENYS